MLPIALLITLFPALAVASEAKSGCKAKKPPASVGTRHEVTLGHSNRTYMYFLPKNYDQNKTNPLILSFHGASRTSDWQADLDLLTDPFFNEDHVVVYPQALQYGDSSTYIYWQGSPNATANDVGYVSDVLDDVEAELCIDKTRIYATGKSQGGGMVGILACDSAASQRIAAFAPVSGAFYTTGPESRLTSCADPETLATKCNPGRDDVPVLDFHGGNDTTISIDGGFRNGGCLPAIRYWVDEWVERNNLSLAQSQTDKLNGSTKVYRYGKGSEEGLVTFVYDGDHVNHDWPATVNNSDNWTHGSGPASFNASSMIMEYFSKYTLPQSDDEGTGNDTSTSVVTPPFTIQTSTATGSITASSTAETTSTSVATHTETASSTTTGSAVSSTPTSGAVPIRQSLENGLFNMVCIGLSVIVVMRGV